MSLQAELYARDLGLNRVEQKLENDEWIVMARREAVRISSSAGRVSVNELHDWAEANGTVPAAELAYSAACYAWPENQTARIALGNNYLQQSRYQEAGLIFAELLAINPNHVAASNNLAEALVKRGCYEQALAVINQTVTIAERLDSPLTQTVRKTQLEISEQMKQVQPGQQGRCTELQ